jgi:hypothetical protein
MSAKILDFPDRRGEPMGPCERQEILLDAHGALITAITEHQTAEGDVPVTFSLDEALELCQAIEYLLGPDHFEDGEAG